MAWSQPSPYKLQFLSNWVPDRRPEMVSPCLRPTSDANQLRNAEPYEIALNDSASGLPCSAIMMTAMFWACACVSTGYLRKINPRWRGSSCPQPESAAWRRQQRDRAQTGPQWVTCGAPIDLVGYGGRLALCLWTAA